MGVLLGEAGFLRQLDVDRALDLIQAEADKVFHAHAVGTHAGVIAVLLVLLFAVDTLGDLERLHLYRGQTHRLVDGHGAADPHGDAFGVFEGEHLPEGAHVQPSLTGLLGVCIPVLLPLHHGGGPLAETAEPVVTAAVRLDENSVAHILHPIANLALDTHVGHLAVAIVVGAGAVAVEGVAVAVGHGDADQGHEVDFMPQGVHDQFSSLFASDFSFLVYSSLRMSQ